MIFFIPVNFPSVYVLDRWGLRLGVSIGMALTIIGLGFRCLMGLNFVWAVAG